MHFVLFCLYTLSILSIKCCMASDVIGGFSSIYEMFLQAKILSSGHDLKPNYFVVPYRTVPYRTVPYRTVPYFKQNNMVPTGTARMFSSLEVAQFFINSTIRIRTPCFQPSHSCCSIPVRNFTV